MFHVKHLNFVENSVGNPYRGNILLQNLPGGRIFSHKLQEI